MRSVFSQLAMKSEAELLTIFHLGIRVDVTQAIRADSMGEISLGMIPYIHLQFLPLPLVVTDFFAYGADWKQ